MSTKVKGLLKGLRYISHMFENEKEEEMQIGFPTDVKHVAHIGLDGPTVNSPSWMNDFKAAQNSNGEAKTPTTQSPSHDFNRSGPKVQDMPVQNSPENPKQSASSNPSPVSSSSRQSCDTSKHGRRHHSSSGTIHTSPSQDPASGGGSSRGRRNRSSNHDPDSTQEIPKHSHRRKSKGSNSSSGDSTRSSRRGRKSSTDLSDPNSESGSVSKSRHAKKKDEMG